MTSTSKIFILSTAENDWPNDCFCFKIPNRKYCFCLVSHISTIILFLTGFLFYREHLHRFSESDLWKCQKKPTHFTTYISICTGHRHFNVLWSFILYILQRFVLSLKNSHYAYIPLYMHKTLPTLGNGKEQQQIKFYKKSSGKLIFLQATKNLKMFYLTHLTGQVFKK